MGRLIDGQWSTGDMSNDQRGRFVRSQTAFREWIRRDGSTPYAAVSGRYHLYASWACPWAHRVLIARKLCNLEDAISVSIADPFMGDSGWAFTGAEDVTLDEINGARFLYEIYLKARPGYTGRVTVPVLWDKDRGTIVNNESREIARMFDLELADIHGREPCLHPPDLDEEVERLCEAIYRPINNGVYRCGFARSQVAYDEAVTELFQALDELEARLASRRYLTGDRFTMADVCLFTTLYRFDPVYHYHFKCNVKRLRDYPNLWGFTRDVYQRPGIREVCKMDQVRKHYYLSHESISPRRIIPAGPQIDYDAPHERARLSP